MHIPMPVAAIVDSQPVNTHHTAYCENCGLNFQFCCAMMPHHHTLVIPVTDRALPFVNSGFDSSKASTFSQSSQVFCNSLAIVLIVRAPMN
jgi:hypothetical protein